MGWIAAQGWDATEAIEQAKEWAKHLPEEGIQAQPFTPVATPVFDGVQEDELRGLCLVLCLIAMVNVWWMKTVKLNYLMVVAVRNLSMPNFSWIHVYLKLHHLVDDRSAQFTKLLFHDYPATAW